MPVYDRQIGVNFLGYESFDTAPRETGGIDLVREFNLLPPDLERWYRLDFDFGFVNDRFFIGCRYARSQYRAATIARHVERIAGDLLAVADGA
jgi:hypothetical protein